MCFSGVNSLTACSLSKPNLEPLQRGGNTYTIFGDVPRTTELTSYRIDHGHTTHSNSSEAR